MSAQRNHPGETSLPDEVYHARIVSWEPHPHIAGYRWVNLRDDPALIYLEDFKSRQARIQHAQFSPLGKLRVRQRGHGRHTYTHGPRTGGLKPRQLAGDGTEAIGENED